MICCPKVTVRVFIILHLDLERRPELWRGKHEGPPCSTDSGYGCGGLFELVKARKCIQAMAEDLCVQFHGEAVEWRKSGLLSMSGIDIYEPVVDVMDDLQTYRMAFKSRSASMANDVTQTRLTFHFRPARGAQRRGMRNRVWAMFCRSIR